MFVDVLCVCDYVCESVCVYIYVCVCAYGVSAVPSPVLAQKLHQTQTSADFKHLLGVSKVNKFLKIKFKEQMNCLQGKQSYSNNIFGKCITQ